MMHLDAIVKRNRRPERQPTHKETQRFRENYLTARYDMRVGKVGPMDREIYVREV